MRLDLINSNPSHRSGTVCEAQSVTLDYRRLERDRSNALHFLVAQLVLRKIPVLQQRGNSCCCVCGLFPQWKKMAEKAELPACSEKSGCLWWTGWKIVFFLFLPFLNDLWYTVKTCSDLLSWCQAGQLNLLTALLHMYRMLSTRNFYKERQFL